MTAKKTKKEELKCSSFYLQIKDGWRTGLEPATFGTTNRRSNQLSYNHHVY